MIRVEHLLIEVIKAREIGPRSSIHTHDVFERERLDWLDFFLSFGLMEFCIEIFGISAVD